MDELTADFGAEPQLDAGTGADPSQDTGNDSYGEQSQTQAQDGTQQGDTASTESASGRSIREAIRAASSQFPEQAKLFKQLADTHFREQAWKQAFPSTQEAVSAKQLIDGLGGVDGATALTQRIQTYEMQDSALKEGNPEVLDSMFKDFPEGAAALAPHYLDRLAQTNPTAFTAAVAPHALSMLEQAGVNQHLDAILAESDPQRASAMVKQLADWLNGQKSSVQQLKQQGQAHNPAQDSIKRERESLQQEKENLFRGQVSEKVNSAALPTLTSEVDKYARQYGLNETQKAHYRKTLEQMVVSEMSNDQTYKQQVDLRYANKIRTHDTFSSYISSEFNRRVKEKSFEVVKSIYGNPRGNAQTQNTGAIKAGQPQTAPGGGPLFVQTKPPLSEMADYPERSIDIIHGRVRLQNGRFVTWRR